MSVPTEHTMKCYIYHCNTIQKLEAIFRNGEKKTEIQKINDKDMMEREESRDENEKKK